MRPARRVWLEQPVRLERQAQPGQQERRALLERPVQRAPLASQVQPVRRVPLDRRGRQASDCRWARMTVISEALLTPHFRL